MTGNLIECAVVVSPCKESRRVRALRFIFAPSASGRSSTFDGRGATLIDSDISLLGNL